MAEEKTLKKDILNYVNFSLCVILSFAGSYFTLSKLGEWRTLFIVIAFAVANAFVKSKWYIKAACFGAFGYVLHAFYGEGFAESLTCALFCAAVMIACCVAAFLFKKKKAFGVIIALCLIMLTAVVHVVLFGSPVPAFEADEKFGSYIASSYAEGTVESTAVRYDRSSGCFVCGVNAVTEPTEVFTLRYENGRIVDTFGRHFELATMKKGRLDVVNALRAVYPDDGFTVESHSIQGFRFIRAENPTDVPTDIMVFDVYISAYLTVDDFIGKAVSYMRTLLDAGVNVGKINFYGGRAGLYYRRLTLDGAYVPYDTTVNFVPHCFADALASRLVKYELPGLEKPEK